jgi:hypothetical protein
MNPFHNNAEMFRDALALTREVTGFPPRLIEKDYYCTVALEYLAANDSGLVFKGGTCMAKIHADFDLDRAFRLVSDMADNVVECA